MFKYAGKITHSFAFCIQVNADTSLEVGADVARSVSSDSEDHEKTAGRLLATELLQHDVVPEHKVLFRVRLSLMHSVTWQTFRRLFLGNPITGDVLNKNFNCTGVPGWLRYSFTTV